MKMCENTIGMLAISCTQNHTLIIDNATNANDGDSASFFISSAKMSLFVSVRFTYCRMTGHGPLDRTSKYQESMVKDCSVHSIEISWSGSHITSHI